MKTIKAYLQLIKWFGFKNATKLIRILRTEGWQPFNWWIYHESINDGPTNNLMETDWSEPEYQWHVPTKDDFKNIEEFIKMYGNKNQS